MIRKFLRRARNLDKRAMSQNPDYCMFTIGKYSYGTPSIHFATSGAKLKIGRFVSIADGVTIFLGGEHRHDWITTYPLMRLFDSLQDILGHPKSKGDVVIGNDVWVGRGAFISSGVNIGDGAVIGAHAVVTNDVAPYSLTAGNPARHIRYRFDDAIISGLLEIRWWDWSDADIERAGSLLLSSDFKGLFEYYENNIK